MILDSVNLTDKIKDFLKLNSYLVWICFILLTLINAIYIGGLKGDLSKTNAEIKQNYMQMKELVEKEIQGVVILTQNGAVLNANKSFLDASTETEYNKAIKNILVAHLVFSNNELTKNFTIKIHGTQDVLNYQPLADFQNNFLADNKKTKDSWEYILGNIAKLSNDFQLPDSIAIVDNSIRNYAWDTKVNAFTISIAVSIKSFFWNNMTKAYDEAQGYYTINAKGIISVKDNTTLNPLGIKFDTISIKIPTKSNNA